MGWVNEYSSVMWCWAYLRVEVLSCKNVTLVIVALDAKTSVRQLIRSQARFNCVISGGGSLRECK